MDPPDNAVILSVDEKTQIQALDRTQPGLPLNPSRIGSRTHDYKRNGTASLYAAFTTLTGKVIGKVAERTNSKDFLSFLLQVVVLDLVSLRRLSFWLISNAANALV